jgi:hypothetical protein
MVVAMTKTATPTMMQLQTTIIITGRLHAAYSCMSNDDENDELKALGFLVVLVVLY